MTTEALATAETERPSFLRFVIWTKVRQAPAFPIGVLTLVVVSAIFAPLLTTYSPTDISLNAAWLRPGTSGHLLGTDGLGRDVLSRLVYGARTSLFVVLGALVIGVVIGGTLGIIAGYKRGKLDEIIMRASDAFLGFPLLLLAILFAAAFGPSLVGIIAVTQITLWPRFARIVRSEVLAVGSSDYISFARVSGASTLWIVWHHVIPHAVNSVVILASLQAGWVIIVEASLSFLGAGIPPPNPSWGGMVSDGRSQLTTAWWVSMFPVVAIVLLVMSLNFIGDWLRDTLDPRLRQSAELKHHLMR